ncbi:MlaD family protein [Segniliparus rugosus]|uniref:Mce/MlaD domain-containing protein n=1 Tax=Segniliparus rugosus (strain ATCC BAA-974 / DSM 45345 / CCUG 50838 / CIP 108380 / JCM 13579 / CDC 945) TaxID=679197 RepID=E5XS59_SEGRC|nr:MlaD family protein [Segniliparus rugosus]EFV12844.1 hypothetical protein HMPREF9336_02331 [Segniliparus rugosus ATCC BAA-974]
MAVFQDLSGRAAGRSALQLRGVAITLVLSLVGIVLYLYGNGAFTPSFKLQVESASVGEGLSVGADVKYRGLQIGKVEGIDTKDVNHQIIRLSLDANQARGLRGITSAKYQASNVFGAPAIELLSGNDNTPLKEGDTVKIASEGRVASITSSLRQIASLTTLLGTEKVQRLLRLVTQNGDILASTLKASFSLGKLYADNLRKRIINQIQDITPIANGFGAVLGPAIRELETLYDHSEFLAHPESRDATVEALLNHRVMVFDELGEVLDRTKSQGVDSIGFLLDIGHPLLMSAGSAASAWGNLETFLNRVEDTMPTIDGKVKLRLEVLLPASRALPQDEEPEARGQSQKQLTPEQQQQVQALQAQILGRAPQQQAAQAPQQQQEQQAPQQQAGSDFATIPTQRQEGGPR